MISKLPLTSVKQRYSYSIGICEVLVHDYGYKPFKAPRLHQRDLQAFHEGLRVARAALFAGTLRRNR